MWLFFHSLIQISEEKQQKCYRFTHLLKDCSTFLWWWSCRWLFTESAAPAYIMSFSSLFTTMLGSSQREFGLNKSIIYFWGIQVLWVSEESRSPVPTSDLFFLFLMREKATHPPWSVWSWCYWQALESKLEPPLFIPNILRCATFDVLILKAWGTEHESWMKWCVQDNVQLLHVMLDIKFKLLVTNLTCF